MTTEPARLIPETASESEPELHEDTYTLDIEATPEDESLSLQDKELEMIKKALERHTGKGKRKKAAEELVISERTLYRQIKQYDLG